MTSPEQDAIETARQFLRDHHHAVLVTRRRDGGVQTSPIAAGLDEAGRAIVSTLARSAKARNLQRDPRATLCVVPDSWFGKWIQVEGAAEVVQRPEAMDLLVDYYRRISGEHPDWADYRRAMDQQGRVLIRITLERAVIG
jgi:PPOX class probable F420-dependent enzyme